MKPHDKGEQDKRDNKHDPPFKGRDFFLAGEERKEQMREANLEYEKGQRYVEGQMDAEKSTPFPPTYFPAHLDDLTRSAEEKEQLKKSLQNGWKNGRDNVRGRVRESKISSDSSDTSDFTSSASDIGNSCGGGGAGGLGVAIFFTVLGAIVGGVVAMIGLSTIYWSGNSSYQAISDADAFGKSMFRPGAIVGGIIGLFFVLRKKESRELILKQLIVIAIIIIALILLGLIVNASHGFR